MSEFEPTKSQMLASVVSGNGNSEYWGMTVNVALRVRYHLFAQISALYNLANENKKYSRNEILNDLLDIGLEQVLSELSSSDKKRFEMVLSDALTDIEVNKND